MKKRYENVFKALADPTRRKILDILKDRPGLSVNDLSDCFAMSRIGLMKHLGVLETCDLVVSQRSGKFKHLYLNAIPLQMVYDRWLSKYSSYWAEKITHLKYQLEKGEVKVSKDNNRKLVNVIYIRTTKEKLWSAITEPQWTSKYYYGSSIQTDLKVGSSVNYDRNGETLLMGEILEVIPYKKLSHTFHPKWIEDSFSRATYELEESGEIIKLTVTHDQFSVDGKTYESVQRGWPEILSSLKSLLETGKALPNQP